MTRDDKHALFAAVAMYVLLVIDQAKPIEFQDIEGVVVDSAWLADQLIQEVEKER